MATCYEPYTVIIGVPSVHLYTCTFCSRGYYNAPNIHVYYIGSATERFLSYHIPNKAVRIVIHDPAISDANKIK